MYLNLVFEPVLIYLVNDSNGKAAATGNSTNFAYAAHGLNFVTTVLSIVQMRSNKKDQGGMMGPK